jgi:hypothetical protein
MTFETESLPARVTLIWAELDTLPPEGFIDEEVGDGHGHGGQRGSEVRLNCAFNNRTFSLGTRVIYRSEEPVLGF